MTQGGPLSAKLFNNVVNAVVHEWMRLMHEMINEAEGDLVGRIQGLFMAFCIDNGYIASRDAEFLQAALNILIKTFKRVGLATNTKKIQARMICMPGRIRLQHPPDSYKCMRKGVAIGEGLQRAVVCLHYHVRERLCIWNNRSRMKLWV